MTHTPKHREGMEREDFLIQQAYDSIEEDHEPDEEHPCCWCNDEEQEEPCCWCGK